MKIRENLAGNVINNRQVLEFIGIEPSGYHSIYKVKCLICQREYNLTKSNLLKSTRCNKCRIHSRGKFSNRWEGGNFIPLNYFNSIKENALQKQLKFCISLDYIEDLYLKQNKECKFTGEFIEFENKTASLDRINSSKGYIKGNVQWVHKDVNKIKNNRNDIDFINTCIKIYQYFYHSAKPIQITPKCNLQTHKNFKGYGYISKDYFTSIKRGATIRNLEFSITIEDLNDLFLWQSGKCILTGNDLYFSKRNFTGNVSLDRINNNIGYTKSNIQWVDKNVNMIKYTLSLERLLDICKKITKKFTTNVAVSGYFQILHVGHIDYISEARKMGGYLTVIVNSDKQAKLKNTPLVIHETERAYIMKHLRGVDEVIIAIDEDGSVSKTLEKIKPHIFCNGGDRNEEKSPSNETLTCKSLGIKMIYGVGGNIKKDSSSKILKRAYEILKQK